NGMIRELEARPSFLNGVPPEALMSRYLKGASFHIADLVRNETRIRGWTFEDCTIYGPAVIATLAGTLIHEPTWTAENVDYVLWDAHGGEDRRWEGLIGLQDCAFRRCTFVRIGILVKPEEAERIRAQVEDQDES
ncbi:MAG: hypothetical protein CYG60_16645, partial [Actinobacteria bacterium]